MTAADRRLEIINILAIRRRTTARELSEELGVAIRTIHKDIQNLSLKFPIYTKQGGNGGIFIGEHYKPYVNTLSFVEVQVLRELYEAAEGIQKEVLLRILRKYGPDKLEI